MFFFSLFAQGALLLAAKNIVGREESKQIGAPIPYTVGHVAAVIATMIIFMLGYLFAPLCGVNTGIFGRLFVRLFVAVLTITNDSIQVPDGDITHTFVEVVQAPATGATTGNFNGLCGARGATADHVSGFF